MVEMDRALKHETAIRLNDAAGHALLSGDLARLSGDYTTAYERYRQASSFLADTAALVDTPSARAVLVGRSYELLAAASRMESLALMPSELQ